MTVYLSITYISDTNLGTNQFVRMSVRERLENNNFCKIWRFGPTLEKTHPIEIYLRFVLVFWWLKQNVAVARAFKIQKKYMFGIVLAIWLCQNLPMR